MRAREGESRGQRERERERERETKGMGIGRRTDEEVEAIFRKRRKIYEEATTPGRQKPEPSEGEILRVLCWRWWVWLTDYSHVRPALSARISLLVCACELL